VEVDTYTITGRADDLFMICSDGLTSMISDEEVRSILRSAAGLEDGAEALVRAANQSGGRDNITVVLFRLGEASEASGAPRDDDTIAGQISADDLRHAADAPTAAPGSSAGPALAERLGDAPADATVVAAPDRRGAPVGARAGHRRGRRRGLRVLVRGLAVVVVLAAVVAGLYALSRQVYFIGTNDAGLVSLYRGVPYELPFGLNLYEEEYASGVPARAIPDRRRERVLDHEWRGRKDAVDLLRALERGQLSG
jgi:protein phosphatase